MTEEQKAEIRGQIDLYKSNTNNDTCFDLEGVLYQHGNQCFVRDGKGYSLDDSDYLVVHDVINLDSEETKP